MQLSFHGFPPEDPTQLQPCSLGLVAGSQSFNGNEDIPCLFAVDKKRWFLYTTMEMILLPGPFSLSHFFLPLKSLTPVQKLMSLRPPAQL